MAFTSREFPGRSFATKEEYEQAKQDKKSIEREIRQPPEIEVEINAGDAGEEEESAPLNHQGHSSIPGWGQEGG